MPEIRVSFAAFLFFMKDTGLEITVHGTKEKRFLTFRIGKSVGHLCQVMPGKNGYDCGYVVINTHDYVHFFGENAKPLDLNTNEVIDLVKFQRPSKKLPDGTHEHCQLPTDLWCQIPMPISSGETVNCCRKI